MIMTMKNKKYQNMKMNQVNLGHMRALMTKRSINKE